MTNPYLLPDGNVAIAFSGGRTSAYMLHQILEANGDLPDRVVVSFQNTGREMPETLDFVQECGDRWGVKIVWLEYRTDAPRFEVVNHNSASRNGEPFEAVIRQRKFLPNRVARFCTQEMKVNTQKRYCMSLGWKNWWSCTGIRADEPARIKPHGEKFRGTRWKNWQPLVAATVCRRAVSAFWTRQPFNLQLPDVDGRTQLGNCDGCFLKSEASRAALARDYPERAKWWSDMEQLAQSISSRPDSALFREDGTWSQLRGFVRNQGDWIFDAEDALCQADGGECLG